MNLPDLTSPLPGLPGALGITIDLDRSQRPTTVRGHLVVGPEQLNVAGTVHAAAVVALADTACGYGCLANLPDHATGFTTLELKSNHLGVAREGGHLQVVAQPVHLGSTTQVWDAEVTVESSTMDGHPRTSKVAVFRCTQMLLSPRG